MAHPFRDPREAARFRVATLEAEVELLEVERRTQAIMAERERLRTVVRRPGKPRHLARQVLEPISTMVASTIPLLGTAWLSVALELTSLPSKLATVILASAAAIGCGFAWDRILRGGRRAERAGKRIQELDQELDALRIPKVRVSFDPEDVELLEDLQSRIGELEAKKRTD